MILTNKNGRSVYRRRRTYNRMTNCNWWYPGYTEGSSSSSLKSSSSSSSSSTESAPPQKVIDYFDKDDFNVK